MQELEKILEEMKKIKDGNRKENLYAKYPPKDEQGKILNGYSQGYEDGTDNFYNVMVDIIHKHMGNDGWIPVEERLPEMPKENPEFEGKKPELYLVTVRGTKYPFRAFWNGSDFTDGWTRCNVTAWCPLPEPYRPERNDGCSSCNHLYGIINLVWYLLM